jgi:hypothetical protein
MLGWTRAEAGCGGGASSVRLGREATGVDPF